MPPFSLLNLGGSGTFTGYVARLGPLALGTRAARRSGGSLAVWPNPARQSEAWVSGAPAGQAVGVYDALGRLVRTAVAQGSTPVRLTLGALPAGLYVVRAGARSAKLIVE
ncbi:T9SS type A sorting domain-containing protein [Hymenobacter algoricola]|uniref:T9SS type A sorting domain-containing protein n=1 Tax=Hymenobacter algoricola TaxID=486267 RepID=A0ABP7MCK5_9BACT